MWGCVHYVPPPMWALILGASSGFGAATARELGRRGMGVCGVHLDRRRRLAHVTEITAAIRADGAASALLQRQRRRPREAPPCARRPEGARRRGRRMAVCACCMHSLAFGSLGPFVGADATRLATPAQIEMTLDVMAHSLVYWVQDRSRVDCSARGSRVLAMTSAGAARVWPGYGAVSAAKAALESHVRQLAVELGRRGHHGERDPRRGDRHAGVAQDPRRRVDGAAGAGRNPSGRMTRRPTSRRPSRCSPPRTRSGSRVT